MDAGDRRAFPKYDAYSLEVRCLLVQQAGKLTRLLDEAL